MKKRILTLCVCLLLAGLLPAAGCSRQDGNGSGNRVNLRFDFAEGDHQGWAGDFTDLPVDYEEDIYELEFGIVDRPAELGSGKAFMISGHNRSDDLFMFLKKQLGTAHGLKPNTTYRIVFEVEFANNAPAGAFGIGGPPGEAVFVKVGAATEEPVPVDINGEWHLNVDKGGQSEGGRNAVVVGDGTKPTSEDFETYELKTVNNASEPLEITTDADGNLWIFVGTDSGFEGKTTLYYTQVSVSLVEK